MDRVRPFSCGSEYADWQWRNCDRCAKRYDDKVLRFRCDLEEALGSGYIGDGTVGVEFVDRIGRSGFDLAARCREWEGEVH